MTGYTDTIRQWATDTRRAGTLPNADGTGEIGLDSEELGSRLAVRFTLKVELDRVTDVRYQVFGCGFSMAACAVAADITVGYALDDIRKIDAKRLDCVLEGLPTDRGYCADLAVAALQAAVKSANNDSQPVQANLPQEAEHEPLVTARNPVYTSLINSPKPDQVSDVDRHLFACLLAMAAQEPYDTALALGLDNESLVSILGIYFPGIERSLLDPQAPATPVPPPERNDEILSILLAHLPNQSSITSVWLARILAARTAHPGHLWVAMGLFERPELSVAIRRHLPSLAAANHQNMRWKRYLFKQLCDLNGGAMCKAPNCGVCSDYTLCFAEEE